MNNGNLLTPDDIITKNRIAERSKEYEKTGSICSKCGMFFSSANGLDSHLRYGHKKTKCYW